jgi:hypothetical protein
METILIETFHNKLNNDHLFYLYDLLYKLEPELNSELYNEFFNEIEIEFNDDLRFKINNILYK